MWSFDYKAGMMPRVKYPYIAVVRVSVACALGRGELTHTLTLIDWYYSNYHRTPTSASQKHCNKFSTHTRCYQLRRGMWCKNNLGYLQYLLRVDKIVCWMKSGGGRGMEIFSGNEQKLIRTQERERKTHAAFPCWKTITLQVGLENTKLSQKVFQTLAK